MLNGSPLCWHAFEIGLECLMLHIDILFVIFSRKMVFMYGVNVLYIYTMCNRAKSVCVSTRACPPTRSPIVKSKGNADKFQANGKKSECSVT